MSNSLFFSIYSFHTAFRSFWCVFTYFLYTRYGVTLVNPWGAYQQEVPGLSATNHLLKSGRKYWKRIRKNSVRNVKLDKQQKKLQQEINKMPQSKEVTERNVHAYDEDVKWQLPEQGTLMSTKTYRDKRHFRLWKI